MLTSTPYSEENKAEKHIDLPDSAVAWRELQENMRRERERMDRYHVTRDVCRLAYRMREALKAGKASVICQRVSDLAVDEFLLMYGHSYDVKQIVIGKRVMGQSVDVPVTKVELKE